MASIKVRAAVAIAAASSCVLPATAQTVSTRELLPAPPGAIVDRRLIAFNGAGIADRWPAIVSKALVGSDGARKFYQWYVSIYTLRRGAYRLNYQSPRNGGALTRVEQANGAKMWFPLQSVKIVGSAPLMHRGVEQLVVASQEMAADCGSASIVVFATKPGGNVGPVVTVSNPCYLRARIGADGTSLELTGSYYNASAPLCCPTKNNATATLRYVHSKWSETPSYFKLQ